MRQPKNMESNGYGMDTHLEPRVFHHKDGFYQDAKYIRSIHKLFGKTKLTSSTPYGLLALDETVINQKN